jgi:hypothetical protein
VDSPPIGGDFLISTLDSNPSTNQNTTLYYNSSLNPYLTNTSLINGTELSTIFQITAFNFTTSNKNYPLKYTYEIYDGVGK